LRNSDPATKTEPQWLVPTLLALAAVLLVGLFSTELGDSDSWWHLKTGEYIVTHHRLPVPDPFAYTTAAAQPLYAGEERTRRFNLTHEWLAQAAMYLAESAGGLGAVVFCRALLMAALCGLTGLMARRLAGSWLWGVAAALAAASLAVEFARDRPTILSFVFTAAFIAIFEIRRRLWILPFLAVVWANCHGGFFLGWVVCAGYSADALLRRAPDARRLLAVSGLCVLLSGLNPNGFDVFATLGQYRSSPMQAGIVEWARSDLWGAPYAFDILLYAAAAVLAWSWRRVRPAHWILFAAFASAALMAARNQMLIGLFAPVLIAAYFPWKRRLPVQARFGATVAILASLAWGIARGDLFQLRAAEWRYPAGAATFLRDHRISVPLFNTYEYGGYLIWRGVPVFVDGRALSESVYRDYRTILSAPAGDPARARLLDRYQVGAILMNSFEYYSGDLYNLSLALSDPAQADWKLVYEDAQAAVFLRDVPADVPILDKRRMPDHFEAECTMHVERDPEFSLCARRFGEICLRTGDRVRARRILGLYLEHPYAGAPDEAVRRAYVQLLGR
jgi:hypothetical protein